MGKHQQREKRDLKYQAAFGRRVKELRNKIGWAQGDLAASSSISEAQISAIENGRDSPQLHTLKSIAIAMGMTPSELLDFPYQLKLNTSFEKAKIRKSGATRSIRQLYDSGFFKSPKSVRDVVEKCEEIGVKLGSAEASGVLLLLTTEKKLKKKRLSKSRNLYHEYDV